MIPRPLYLNALRSLRNVPLVKILVGVRRCGKSTILAMLREELIASGIPEERILARTYTSEDIDHALDDRKMYLDIRERMKGRGFCYLLLDEVQEIENWEKAINSLLEEGNADIYVTGSNSRLMASEISTYLSGRYVSILVYPLSLGEYQDFRAVGHDPQTDPGKLFDAYLRTPLTRLQLRLDRVEPEPLRAKLQETASSMRAIISQGLELARSLNTDEAWTRLDMRSFLQSVADDHADVGARVSLEDNVQGASPVVVPARPLCLRRCLDNLITNACIYGGSARIGLAQEGENVVVTVADDGPGIPEDMLERVFEPYFRLESSRNPSSGGIGLGLAIARNMALLNNGEIQLCNRAQGGLEARVVLTFGDKRG